MGSMQWVWSGILGTLFLSVMSFLITVMTRKGYPVGYVLFWVGIVFVVGFGIQMFVFSNYKPQTSLGSLLLLIFIGALSVIGNLLIFQAANDSPNPGLVWAFLSLESGIVAILAYIFLHDKVAPLQIVGIILAILAVTTISLGSSQSDREKDTPPLAQHRK